MKSDISKYIIDNTNPLAFIINSRHFNHLGGFMD